MKLSCRTSVGQMSPPLRRPSSKVLHPIKSVRCFSSSPEAAGVFSVASSASHLHTSTPWLMLPPEIDPTTNRKVDRFYSFIEKQVFKLDRKEILKVPEDARCFGSSCGWLGFIDPNDCSLYLSNPFRDSPLVRLPSIETLSDVVGIKRKPSSTILDSFIVERRLVEPYASDDYLFCSYYLMDPESLSESIAQRLTLLSGDIFREKEDCMVFLHTKTSGLALCRVGSDDSWTMFDYSTPRGYGYHIACPFNDGGEEKLFYSMYSDVMTDLDWDIPYSYAYRHFNVIRFWEVLKPEKGAPNMRGDFVGAQRNRWNNGIKFETSENQYLEKLRYSCTEDYLGADKSSGDIMLVIRHTVRLAKDGTILFYSDPDFDYSQIASEATRFEVYKVDKMEQKLKHLKSLGDRVLLLYRRQCFIFSAREEFPGFNPNSIYFENESPDWGIYNLEDNSIEPYEFPDELRKDKTMWPPLFWVSPIL